MTRYVIDSSAVLANIAGEPGAEIVQTEGKDAMISAVNFAEIITKLIEFGLSPDEARFAAERGGFEIIPVDQQRASLAGMLHAKTRRTGVSLGDRFCLALAQETGHPVLTSDRRWATLDLGVEVVLIR